MDLEFKKKQSVLTKYHIDPDTKKPTSVPVIEKQQVHPLKNLIQMVGEVKKNKKIQIIDRDMIPVNKPEKITQPYHYYVDYEQNLIHFHPDVAGQTIEYKYEDMGVTVISANKIFTKQDEKGNVIELLEDIIRLGREAIDVMETIGGVAIVMKRLEDDIKEGYEVSQQIQDDIQQAKDEVINVQSNKEVIIKASEWILNGDGYEKEITHTCNSENLHVTAKNSDTKEATTIGYKILDKARILLKSDEAINMSVILSASYYHATQTISDNIAEEVVKARKGEVDLKTKIDSIDSQLDKIKEKINYREIQTNLLSDVLKKIRTENIQCTIDLQGDSMFYGYDVVSDDKREASSELTDDETAHKSYQTRSSVTIAESLQEGLNTLFGEGKFVVKNKGYSGDTVITGMNHWNSTNIGDLSILGYGINDSRGAATAPYKGDVISFLDNYRKLIEFKLSNGSAVVIISPLKSRFHYSSTIITDIYEAGLENLCKEYNIPFINGDLILKGMDYSYYSDTTHLNGKGYDYVGKKLVSLFIGNTLIQKTNICNTRFLTTNYNNENLIYNSLVSVESQIGFPTPSEGAINSGYGLRLKANGVVTYSCYMEQENNIIIPSIYSGTKNENIRVEVNFGLNQPYQPISYINNCVEVNRNATLGYIDIPTNNFEPEGILWEDDFRLGNNISPLLVTTNGYCTITIKNTTSSDIILYGLYIKEYEDYYKGDGKYICVTHVSYDSTESISETRVKESDLYLALGLTNRGLTYFYQPLLNLTISNKSGSLFETYNIRLSRNSCVNFGSIGTTSGLINGNRRILDSIAYDSATKEYVFTWSGVINEISLLTFTLGTALANVQVLNPSSQIPPAQKGALYFNNVTSKFMKCEDGENWVEM